MESLAFNAGLVWSHYKQVRFAFFLAAFVAFLMSSYFVVGYLTGSLEFWHWGASEWLNACAGFGITLVMTAYQFFLYSSGDIAGASKATILAVCVAVGFSLLSEVGQGMERDHIRMEVKSQQSPTYQALIKNLENGQNNGTINPYAYSLNQAEIKLARCRENVANGVWNDCVESEARLNNYQKLYDNYYTQQGNNKLALTDKAKSLEKDESNYHPLVNLVRSVFGSSGAVASFLVSLVLISFFEYAFHYLGGRLAMVRRLLMSSGYDVTAKIRKSPLLLNRTDTPANDIPQNLTSKGSDGVLGADLDLTSKVDNEGLEPVYLAWKECIKNGEIKPTIPPSKRWLKSQGIGGSDNERQQLTGEWLQRLEHEGGVIELNPDKGNGKPKYLLLGGGA